MATIFQQQLLQVPVKHISHGKSTKMIPTAGRKISTTMIVFAACVLGLGLGLFGINYWHATKCSSDRSPDEIEDMIVALKNRLLESESKILKNELMMNKLIASMQSNLYKIEQIEYNELTVHANNEAVEIALLLAAHPAPPMPIFQMDSKYADAEGLANAIDDIFSKEGSIDPEYYGGLGGEGNKDRQGDNPFENELAEEEPVSAITDAEAIESCTEWKNKYNVIVGASWGDLPYDLQQKWLEYSCDYHLKDEGNPAA